MSASCASYSAANCSRRCCQCTRCASWPRPIAARDRSSRRPGRRHGCRIQGRRRRDRHAGGGAGPRGTGGAESLGTFGVVGGDHAPFAHRQVRGRVEAEARSPRAADTCDHPRWRRGPGRRPRPPWSAGARPPRRTRPRLRVTGPVTDDQCSSLVGRPASPESLPRRSWSTDGMPVRIETSTRTGRRPARTMAWATANELSVDTSTPAPGGRPRTPRASSRAVVPERPRRRGSPAHAGRTRTRTTHLGPVDDPPGRQCTCRCGARGRCDVPVREGDPGQGPEPRSGAVRRGWGRGESEGRWGTV